jgi:3'-phosphoadenosine 5'-phosphosulfate (PAPS) 3'-phosphatase
MTTEEAFNLFEEMISVAKEELVNFTLSSNLSIEKKADKSMVTECDKAIDIKLTQLAQNFGLKVVSEEGEHIIDIVKDGNYITIDPIDGTLGYIDHVNSALEKGSLKDYLLEDLGANHDFGLLLGIVENNEPRFGACYNFCTREKILIDSYGEILRENNVRNYNAKNAVYVDQRAGEDIEQKLRSLDNVTIISQATLGLKSLYTVLNNHESAVTVHRVQSAGVWDIMPAAVAAKIVDAQIYDDLGNPLEFNKYILLPGKGATIIRGEKFKFVVNDLKNIPNKL